MPNNCSVPQTGTCTITTVSGRERSLDGLLTATNFLSVERAYKDASDALLYLMSRMSESDAKLLAEKIINALRPQAPAPKNYPFDRGGNV